MEIAGIFWKNPMLLRMKSNPILEIMRALNDESLIMFVPHLEQWVLEHVLRSKELGDADPFVVCSFDANLGLPMCDPSLAVFETGSSVLGNKLTVRSIKCLYEGSGFEAPSGMHRDPERESTYAELQMKNNLELIKWCPIFEWLVNGSGEWWLFKVENSVLYQPNYWWIIVDYQGKRLWGNMCEQKMCFWDDIWEVKTWMLQEPFKEDWIVDHESFRSRGRGGGRRGGGRRGGGRLR
jgi:hypothetical protein